MNYDIDNSVDRDKRQTLALESIAESLRQLPTKRELLAAITASGIMAANPPSTGEFNAATIAAISGQLVADAIIAACKEKVNET